MGIPFTRRGERLLVERQAGLALLFLEADRHHRGFAWDTLGFLPGEGERQPPRLVDLPVNARHPEVVALRRPDARPEAAALAEVHLTGGNGEVLGSPPLTDMA